MHSFCSCGTDKNVCLPFHNDLNQPLIKPFLERNCFKFMIQVINPKNWIIFTNRYRIRKNIQSKVNWGLIMNGREKRIFVSSARTERVRLNRIWLGSWNKLQTSLFTLCEKIQLWKYQSRVCEIMYFATFINNKMKFRFFKV